MPPKIAIASTANIALLRVVLAIKLVHDHRIMNLRQKSCALLADEHTRYVEGVRGLLETEFDAIFTVADPGSLIEGTDRLQPTVIVVDLPLAKGDFANLIGQLRKSSPGSKIIALTVHIESPVVEAMLSAGAHGVVLKHFIARDLLAAVDATLEGDTFVTPDVGPVQIQNPARPVEQGGR